MRDYVNYLDGKINELEERKNRVVKNNEVLMDQVQGLKSEKNRLIIERNKLIAELAYEESKVLKSVVVGDLNLREKSRQTYSFEIPKNAKDVVFIGKSESEKSFTFYLFDERNFLLWKANEKSKVFWQSTFSTNEVEQPLPWEKDVYYLVIIAPKKGILPWDPEILPVNVEFHVRYRIEE